MKVTALIEDHAGADATVTPEFGLSLHIETGGQRILMDTGSSDRFVDNARALGIDIAAVDACVLSHGHFDHGGGLAAFLATNTKAPVYVRPGVDRERIGSLAPGLPDWLHRAHLISRDIGIDARPLRERADRFVIVEGALDLGGGARLLTDIPRAHPLPPGNRYLLERVGPKSGRLVRDAFEHELLLVVDEGQGPVVFSGCAHRGILNMLDAALTSSGAGANAQKARAVIGGFHLVRPRSRQAALSDTELDALASALAERVEGPIITGHCTGLAAFDRLKRSLGDQLQALRAGTDWEL
jgi:7,8-dihydropterin-6-yl-methyl-4-(beta-D-ribofuranosyl)aminobenzene 5'-phosphate synthase